jgi:hypothetical protein
LTIFNKPALDLPNNLWQKVLNYTDARTILRIERVAKRFDLLKIYSHSITTILKNVTPLTVNTSRQDVLAIVIYNIKNVSAGNLYCSSQIEQIIAVCTHKKWPDIIELIMKKDFSISREEIEGIDFNSLNTNIEKETDQI